MRIVGIRYVVTLGVLSRVFRFWFSVLFWVDILILMAAVPAILAIIVRKTKSYFKAPIWLYALPFLTLVALSAYNAHTNFGQSFAAGIVTESRLMYPIVIAGFFLIFPRFSITERGMVFLGLALLSTYAIFHLGVRSGILNFTSELMIGFDELRGGERVKLNLTLPIVLSAFFVGKKTRSNGETLFVIATLMIVFFMLGGRLHTIAILLPIVSVVALKVFVFFAGAQIRAKYVILALPALAAFAVVLTNSGILTLIFRAVDTILGNNGNFVDTSSMARVEQFVSGWNLFEQSGWGGIGKLSNQTDGGFSEVIGYFHFEDLGVLGVFMIYGIAGVLLYLLPVVALFKRVIGARSMAIYSASLSFGFLYLATVESMLYSGLYFIMFFFINKQAVEFSKQTD